MGRLTEIIVRLVARETARSGWRTGGSGRLSGNGFFRSPVLQRRRSSAKAGSAGSIEAAVVLERLPVVLPPLHADVARFRQFSFEWRQQHQRHYPQELLDLSSARSLKRALRQRLYLVVYGVPPGSSERNLVWHFPSKLYSKEPSLRQCAEAALGSLIGDASNAVYFVGNAPCGHLLSETPSVTRFFFRSQLLSSDLQLQDKGIMDFAWIAKQELPLFFDKKEAEYLNDLLQW